MTSISGSSSASMMELHKQIAQERFQNTDTDEDGKISLGEFETGAPAEASTTSSKSSEIFSSLDSNGDGYLVEEEMQSGMEAGPPGGGKGPPPGGMPPPPGGGSADGATMAALFDVVSSYDEEEETSITSLYGTDDTEEEDSIVSLLGVSETDSFDETDSSETSEIQNLISEQIEQYRSASNAYQASTNLLSFIGDEGLSTA